MIVMLVLWVGTDMHFNHEFKIGAIPIVLKLTIYYLMYDRIYNHAGQI